MMRDPYLKSIAIMVSKGFNLKDIWDELPWDGDMPDDMVEVFGSILLSIDNERIQRLGIV